MSDHSDADDPRAPTSGDRDEHDGDQSGGDSGVDGASDEASPSDQGHEHHESGGAHAEHDSTEHDHVSHGDADPDRHGDTRPDRNTGDDQDGHDDHEGHKGHNDHVGSGMHAGHEQLFRRRFFVSTLLSVPVLLYSETLQTWLGFSVPAVPGSEWINPVFAVIVFAVIVFAYGGVPFLRMAVPELRDRALGMMTLI